MTTAFGCQSERSRRRRWGHAVTAMIWTAACIGRGNPLAACDAAVQENARCGSVSLVADAVAHQTLAAFTSGAQVRGQSAPHFSASTARVPRDVVFSS